MMRINTAFKLTAGAFDRRYNPTLFVIGDRGNVSPVCVSRLELRGFGVYGDSRVELAMAENSLRGGRSVIIECKEKAKRLAIAAVFECLGFPCVVGDSVERSWAKYV